jgi:hypothetical protein
MALLETVTYKGLPDGSNLAQPAHAIQDTEARYIQDGLVFLESELPRRGPLSDIPGVVMFSYKGLGLAFTRTPQGIERIGVINGDISHAYLSVLSSDYSSKVDLDLGGGFTLTPRTIVEANPVQSGGVYIGISDSYEQGSGRQDLIFWNGAQKPSYTVSATTTYNSKTVTGTGFTANVEPGMFLFITSGDYIGMVNSVESDTSLTLQEPALFAAAATSMFFVSIRGWIRRVTSGGVTLSTATPTVTGSNTKFVDEGVAANWRLFRAADLKFIGTVLSVTNNNSLTLTANALLSMQNDDYLLVPSGLPNAYTVMDTSQRKPGFLSAAHVGLQFFANRRIPPDTSGDFTARLNYSNSPNPEDMDLSLEDGNFIPVTSSTDANMPITSLVSAYNSLLIFKSNETFTLIGKNPNQFEIRKILDDGALSGMSAIPFQGGAIWAGRNGIYQYDGISVENLIEDNLGDYYSKIISGFDPNTHRMWGFVHREHYFLHIEHVENVFPVTKNVTSTLPTRYTICIYLPRRAVTFMTNVNLVGGITIPGASGENAWILVNDGSKAHLCNVDKLFDEQGNDDFIAEGNTVAGPDFFIESKKYDAGDGMLKKLWKQVQIHYLVLGDSLRLDTVVGLNDVGSQRPSAFEETGWTWDLLPRSFRDWVELGASFFAWDTLGHGIFVVKRIKFIKRDQYFAFRLYQNSANVSRAALGPFAIAFKRQRPGRV